MLRDGHNGSVAMGRDRLYMWPILVTAAYPWRRGLVRTDHRPFASHRIGAEWRITPEEAKTIRNGIS